MDNWYKTHEVLVSVLVTAPNPQSALSIVQEAMHRTALCVACHPLEAHEIHLPNRRHSDRVHHLDLPDDPETDFTGSGARLNESAIAPLRVVVADKSTEPPAYISVDAKT